MVGKALIIAFFSNHSHVELIIIIACKFIFMFLTKQSVASSAKIKLKGVAR